MDYRQTRATPASPIDHDSVNQKRPAYVKQLLTLLQQLGFRGTFVYRSNLCNADFEARAADVEVEQVVHQLNGTVLNLYNASVCRGAELFRDHNHFDREFVRLQPADHAPHLGELNVVGLQGLLNGICNPLLFRT